jgi:hypothetical protein
MGRVSPECTVIRPVRGLTYDRTRYNQMSLSSRVTRRMYWMREGNVHGRYGLNSEQLQQASAIQSLTMVLMRADYVRYNPQTIYKSLAPNAPS